MIIDENYRLKGRMYNSKGTFDAEAVGEYLACVDNGFNFDLEKRMAREASKADPMRKEAVAAISKTQRDEFLLFGDEDCEALQKDANEREKSCIEITLARAQKDKFVPLEKGEFAVKILSSAKTAQIAADAEKNLTDKGISPVTRDPAAKARTALVLLSKETRSDNAIIEEICK